MASIIQSTQDKTLIITRSTFKIQIFYNFLTLLNFEIKLKVLCQKTVKELAFIFKTDKQKRHLNKGQNNKNGAVHFLEEKINCTKIIKLTKQRKI